MRTTKYDHPNTTILIPGGCNAGCRFCFWNRDDALIIPPEDYVPRLFSLLARLPEEFSILSISGGEPTASPYFESVLAQLGVYRRNHYLDRVVLTTNGYKLKEYLAVIGATVDHINISRHTIGTQNNRDIFGTDTVPTDVGLRDLITRIHTVTLCDVTLNCVVSSKTTEKFCHDFLVYAKALGADTVCFRKEAGNIDPTPVEKHFLDTYGIITESECPVCRSTTQRVKGYPVIWRASSIEPSLEENSVYEVIIRPDGNVYVDWAGTVIFTEPLRQECRRDTFISSGRGYGGGTGCSGRRYSGC